MSPPTPGKKAPAIALPATDGKKVKLTDFVGQSVVVYFYPRDNTPGCTTESAEFAAAHAKFKRANTVILGISQDSLVSHAKFVKKLDLPFVLLSDEDGKVCSKYDVLKLKKMYGKEFTGIERSTFLIDNKGVLVAEWRKVKVAGHVDEVLAAAKSLNKASKKNPKNS
ncbi:MAG: peroxiredoxin [Granulosicoccus sp.]|nr:peroxiredoxin [Granulosicoccus sp.]